MSLTPPDNWTVISGNWDTNFDLSTSIYMSGLSSLKITGTSVAAPKIVSGFAPASTIDILNPGNVNPGLLGSFAIRSSSNNPAHTITISVVFYRADRTTIDSTNTIFNAAVGAANTWYLMGDAVIPISSLAKWVRYEITKANAAFDVYIDFVRLSSQAAVVCGSQANALTLTTSYQTITWQTANVQVWGKVQAGGNCSIYESGIYHVTAHVRIVPASDNTTVQMYLVDGVGAVLPGSLATLYLPIGNSNYSTTISTSCTVERNLTTGTDSFGAQIKKTLGGASVGANDGVLSVFRIGN